MQKITTKTVFSILLFFFLVITLSMGKKNIEHTHLPVNNQKYSLWKLLKGKPASNQLSLGTFVWHYDNDARKQHDLFTYLISISYKGLCWSAFQNCYQKTSMLFGICRDWFVHKTSSFEYIFGFYTGLVTGYGEELCSIASYTPAVPFLSLCMRIFYKNIGIDTSLSLYVSFANIVVKF